MRIAAHRTLTIINAGKERTSSLILPSDCLIPVSGDLNRRHSTGDSLRPPKFLEHLLMLPELTSEIEEFFDPEDYVPLSPGERFNLTPGQYELVPTANPFRHEHNGCKETWFAVAGVAERVGMPLACWAEHIARGSVEFIQD